MNVANNKLKFAFILATVSLCCCSNASKSVPDVFPDSPDDNNVEVIAPYKIQTRKNSTSSTWTTYDAYTLDCLKGFIKGEAEPVTDKYGGWKVGNNAATGFFRVEKIGSRWWLITPEGNLYISKGVTAFSPGNSVRSKSELQKKFGTVAEWAKKEIVNLKDMGFNSVGAWSRDSEILRLKDEEKIPYTVIVSPMGALNGAMKSRGEEKEGYAAAGWEGYPYDFASVFSPEFDKLVEEKIKTVSKYKDDPYCIGYFTDNEIPWKDYALEKCLTKWPAGHLNHDKAQEWLDARKGMTGATISDATDSDKKAFIAYCLETYLQKVTSALKKYDPNHLYLGCRFNQWKYELKNEEIFKVAGKYMDVISLNHYQKWEPDETVMRNWELWSGRPFLVTEFYVKGEDSGLPNATGAGWNVKTQKERGYFYQNFVRVLVKGGTCIGWHWFKYMDNDPEDTSADPSNRDSNKGIVKWNFDYWTPLSEEMNTFNHNVWNLINYYDDHTKK